MKRTKKISPARKAKKKRQLQKRMLRRKWIISFVGVLLTTTLLGAAFFFGNHDSTYREKSVTQTTAKHELPSVDKRKKAQVSEPKSATHERSDDQKIGFGLEDLIAKMKKNSSSSQKATIRDASHSHLPELVLIIDDVSQRAQLKKITSLPYHITPSIFPPSRMNAKSYLLARGLKHYMIHLPMQSSSAKMNRFRKTMMIHDSPEKIAARIREIRRLFPTAKFVNNHTGSVFTSNYAAMRRAYIELKRNGFIFLDSRTTGKSVVRKITKIYHDPYLSRDIFLDNVQKRSAILAQLKHAVRIAKKRGYAIAIGHPHPTTLDALHHASKILAGVETVYLDDFYKEHYANR